MALLRTLAALLAGANRMAWPRFLFMNATGGVLWASLFGGGAYLFGERITTVAGPVSVALLVVAFGFIVAGFFYLKRFEKTLEKQAAAASLDDMN